MAGPVGSTPKPCPCLGFITVLECSQDGLFGGYLAIDFRGRPLEFRCTAPIKPNRAQQILYGPTLNSYLYGEQIGQALLKGSEHDLLAVFTDRPAVMAVREFIEWPVVLVENSAGQLEPAEVGSLPQGGLDGRTWQVHAAHAPEATLKHFHWGCNRLAARAQADDDEVAAIVQRLAPLAESFDLAEPFVRIREAIEEARRAGG